MLDNIKRKELLSKARQAGFPGSILDVFSAYEQGRDLIAEYQQEQKMKQAQQMSDFVASQTLQQPQMQQPQQAQQQLSSSPPVVQANVPVQMPEQQQPLVDSSRSTNVGIVPNQTGSYKGEAIFAKGGFKKDPPNQSLSSMGAENRLYTYKTDPNWFDNRSTYSDNSKYSDQIRHAVYSGNYGYNPVTGVLEKLPTNKRANVSTETQRRLAEGENKQAYQKSIVDAGFNPETFAKPTAEEEKALEDRRIKDYVIKGHELAINNPVFKAGAYLTPAGMAVGAVEGAAHFLPDVYNFAENPSLGTAGKLGMDALLAAPIARQLFSNARAPQVYNYLPEGMFSGYSKLRDPNKSYRVTGMDAFEDFKNTGILRSITPMSQPGMSLAQRLQQRPTGFPSFQKGYADLAYLPEEGGVVFETSLPTYKRGNINPVTGKPIKGRHYAHRVIDPKTGATVTNIPGADVRVFEGNPHWLKGYQQIKFATGDPLPKAKGGFKGVAKCYTCKANKLQVQYNNAKYKK